MRKKIILSALVLCMILFCMSIVNAATGSASFTASSTSVKQGGTFTVTLSAKCDDGLNGVNTSYSYSEDKLELVSANVASNKWASLGVGKSIQVISNVASKLTSEKIYVLTFKVKDNATVGTTAEVTIDAIKVDTDVSASKFTEGSKTVSINIVSADSGTSDGNSGNGSTGNGSTGNGSTGSGSTGSGSTGSGSTGTSKPGNSSTGTSKPGNGSTGTEKPGNDEQENNYTVDGIITIAEGTDNSITGTVLDASSDIYKEMKAKLHENGYDNVFCAYDLKVTGNTENGILLTFNVGTEHNGKQAMVLHKKSNGEYDDPFEVIVVNGKVEITVKEFSPFMLALKDKVDDEPNNKQEDNLFDNKLPQTGENNIALVLAIIVVAVLVIAFAVTKLRKNNRSRRIR